MTNRLVLARHPAVVSGGRCYGRLDVPLVDPESVGILASKLAVYGGTVWTSPADRCRAVAAATGAHCVDDRLQELDFGEWEGVPWDDIPRALLDAWAADPLGFSPPGGETGDALMARVRAFYDALSPGTHVVITHGGPSKVLGALMRGEAVDLLAPVMAPGQIENRPRAQSDRI